ncbi:MAG: hypothetical protein ACFFE4_07935 [Candidatus Thorarchaeota archaeon]
MVMSTLKAKIRKCLLVSYVILVILMAFFIQIPTIESQIFIKFSIENGQRKYRVGYPITFAYEIWGNPPEVLLIWGDGTVETITDQLRQEDGKFFGSSNHSYAIQGRYTPQCILYCVYFK